MGDLQTPSNHLLTLCSGGHVESEGNVGLSSEFRPGSLRTLGFVPLGQRMPETISVLFPQLHSGPDMSKWEDRTWESCHT